MIELTWEQIAVQPFQQAVVAINNARDIDAKTVYRAGRICQVARKEAEKIQDVRASLAKKHGFNKETFKFPSPEAEELYKQELDKVLTENSVQIKVHPLDWNEFFGKVELTGLELVHVQVVCCNIKEDEEI